MKLIKQILKMSLLLAFIATATISCIKSEATNAEADIVDCELESGKTRANPMITNNSVTLLVYKDKIDPTQVVLNFTLTDGATIVPASGSVVDFTTVGNGNTSTNRRTFTVTAEDGVTTKKYDIIITDQDIPTQFDFEFWHSTKKYEIPYQPVFIAGDRDPSKEAVGTETGGESENHIKLMIWSSGNAGYSLVATGDPKSFPTCSSTDSQKGRLAAKLETKVTGFIPLPLAAGNLFLGAFDATIAMQTPMEATRFGVPFNNKPLKFTGWYKYKSGREYKRRVITNGKTEFVTIPEKENKDKCDIYAVLYYKDLPNTKDKNEDGSSEAGNTLHGANVKTSDRIIALAQVQTKQVGQYEMFEAVFDYNYPVEFDTEKMKNHDYYLAVVFSASEEGAKFGGAIGSTLYIDNVNIECATEEGL